MCDTCKMFEFGLASGEATARALRCDRPHTAASGVARLASYVRRTPVWAVLARVVTFHFLSRRASSAQRRERSVAQPNRRALLDTHVTPAARRWAAVRRPRDVPLMIMTRSWCAESGG